MGMLASEKTTASPTTKKTKPLDASSLKPLKSNKGTVGFTGYRDAKASRSSFDNGKADDDEESDEEGSDVPRKRKSTGPDKNETEDANGDKTAVLSPEEAAKSGELADSVKKMQLKRQHSFEASGPTTAPVQPSQASDSQGAGANEDFTPPSTAHPDDQLKSALPKLSEPSASVGSPFKKQRASLSAASEPSANHSAAPFAAGNDVHPLASATNTSSSNEPSVNGVTSDQVGSPSSTQAQPSIQDEL